jgi:GH43 family beta-xylosidase
MLNFFVARIIRSKNVQATNVSAFYNVYVIAQNGADPCMYKHTDQWYYLTHTNGENVQIWRSRSLTSIAVGDTISACAP